MFFNLCKLASAVNIAEFSKPIGIDIGYHDEVGDNLLIAVAESDTVSSI